MYYPRQYCRLCLSYRHSAAPSIRVSIAGCVSLFVLTVQNVLTQYYPLCFPSPAPPLPVITVQRVLPKSVLPSVCRTVAV